ncbi:hypothetical protein [Haloferax sp. YSSS75]|uniref:DUF7262 family protein n=1 Tax=Haloferax sp. YSSS75 TaxID=3388564 RepID=UPI00398D283D
MRDRRRTPRSQSRGQLSLTVVEGTVATLFILVVAAGFALTPTPAVSASLDQQATDAASMVATVPAGETGTLLETACTSPEEFDTRATQLHSVASSSLPDSAFVSIRTPVGTAGTPPPERARTASAPAVVPGCTATVEVWYP